VRFVRAVAALAGLSLSAQIPPASAHGAADAALRTAIADGDDARALAALAAGADPDLRGNFGATPLAWAVERHSADLVAALLKAGAKPDLADIDGVTPLGLACELGDGARVDQLLDAHAGVVATRPDGVTPLAICARFAPSETVAQLLARGAAPDPVDAQGQTPLMWAASANRADSVALLLKAGADVNRRTRAGFTPLAFAIKSGQADALRLILAAGGRDDWRGPEHTSALQLALYQKNTGAAALLLARMADAGPALGEYDREGHLPLHVAAGLGEPMLVGMMLAKGADANALSAASKITWVTEANFGLAPRPVPPTPALLMAAAHGDDATMKLLLAAGANPRFVTSDGINVVLAATQGGKVAALDLALGLAPDANVAGPMGMTPLHMLATGLATSVDHSQRLAMLRLLAAHGARSDIPSKPMGFGEKGKTENQGKTSAQMAAEGVTEVREDFQTVFPPAPAAGALATRAAARR
jgi:ankyrin repeat protein